jgi:succinate dehydrogenase / fumarate reductase cytochrome b subunit
MQAASVGFYGTSVGKKVVMAVTGLLMVFFVVVHMLGNLQMFGGPERMNAYARLLHSMPGLLWGFRGVLGLAALLHIVTALQLIARDLTSRPSRYARRSYVEATLSSRTMLYTGPLLLTYLIYHLLQLTLGNVLDGFVHLDAYGNVVRAFSLLPSAVVYIAAMVVLGLHIKHGIWSMFQTVGLNSPRYDRLIRGVALLVSLAVAAGFISVPASVLAGWLR